MRQPREPQGTPKGGQFACNPYSGVDDDLDEWNAGECQKSCEMQSDPPVVGFIDGGTELHETRLVRRPEMVGKNVGLRQNGSDSPSKQSLLHQSGVSAHAVGQANPARIPKGKTNPLIFRLDHSERSAQLFYDRIADLKRNAEVSATVDVHEPEEYLDCDLYLTEDGRAGFAIKNGNELVSVFSYTGERAGDALVEKAVENGARRLDCFDIKGFLPRLYGRHGFQPVARVRWDDEYAPDDWDYGRLGRPDVVAMAVTDHVPEHVEYMDYDHACGLAAELAENEMGKTSGTHG